MKMMKLIKMAKMIKTMKMMKNNFINFINPPTGGDSSSAAIDHTSGITMLLTLLITAALMAMSGSIFSFLITELRMSGELSDSFYAMYAADEGMERAFYDDRIRGLYPNPGVYTIPSGALSNGSCYTATITRGAVTTTIKSVGKYQCSGGSRQLQRSFEATYQ